MSKQDVVIIGGGSGGYVCAIRAAQLGLRVVLVEKERLGGVCLNWGCIPTKTLLRSAAAFQQARRLAEFGVRLNGELLIDWPAMLARKQQVVETLVDGVAKLLTAHGVQALQGVARLESPQQVAVDLNDGRHVWLETKNVVVATGSTPAQPPIPGLDLPGVVSSDGILSLETLPRRLVVIGGGVIGVEFAVLFATLGVRVTVLEMLPHILPPVDRKLSRRYQVLLRQQGIEVRLKARVDRITRLEAGLRVDYSLDDQAQTIDADRVLNATGRLPFSDGLGLDELGVIRRRGCVPVNDRLQSNVPGVYAVGDVTGQVLLAHVAARQGEVAAEVIAGHNSRMDYRAVPNVVFSLPEIAGVGLTSQEAKEQGIAVQEGAFSFSALGKALAQGETEGQVRLLCQPESGRVLGMHVIGPGASDLVAEGALAVQAGLTARQIAGTIHAHPTLPEAVAEAARVVAFGEAIHQKKLSRSAHDPDRD
ncbi:MAG: dihydrolipoyl dehydrogenase [Chloroflexota bacterium]